MERDTFRYNIFRYNETKRDPIHPTAVYLFNEEELKDYLLRCIPNLNPDGILEHIRALKPGVHMFTDKEWIYHLRVSDYSTTITYPF
jgi:hypothetical protein